MTEDEKIVSTDDCSIRMFADMDARRKAFRCYQTAMSPEEYDAFTVNEKRFIDICGLFYGTKTRAELDSYMEKTPAELAELVAQKNEARDQAIMDTYRLGDACERAFLRYEMSLSETSPEEYRALKADRKRYFDLSRLFYGAATQAELDSYMDRTPAELAEIVAQNDRRYSDSF